MSSALLLSDMQSTRVGFIDPLCNIELAGKEDIAARAEMEAFIAQAFLQCYSANLTSFMPWLLGIRREGDFWGAAGLRPAMEAGAAAPLFIEQYLDQSIEQLLGQHIGSDVRRSSIVEVGNLAGHRTGITRALFPLLTELLHENGYEWVVCNATKLVQNALIRQGFAVQPLVRAEPERLGPARFSWGRYYDSETTVIGISVPKSHAALEKKPGILELSYGALSGRKNSFPLAPEFGVQ